MGNAGGGMKLYCISFFLLLSIKEDLCLVPLFCNYPLDLFQIAQENNIPPELSGCWEELLLHLLTV